MTADAVSCVLDSLGVCTVSHALGVVPTAVVVSANTPAGWNGFMLNTVRDSFTPTTFRVRAMVTSTQPKSGATIWFSYSAFAAGATPQPPTTTVMPPVTTTMTTMTTEPPAVTTTRPVTNTTPPTTITEPTTP